MSFKDKVVLVTGASSGIGAGIAIGYSKEGANVVITGRNEEKLKNVAVECKKYGTDPLVIKADIANEDDAKRTVKTTIDKYGKLDILINNAGIAKMASIMSENILAVYDEVLNINTRAVLHMTHLAAPYLIESKGNVIVISSIGSMHVPSSPHFLSYVVSKAAVDQMARCIAAELAPKGVRVNTVNPGPVKTDIADNAGFGKEGSQQFWQRMQEGTALKRISGVEEVADLVLYLTSDKAIGITGSNFVLDNGMLLKS